jgi:hypothetical protein
MRDEARLAAATWLSELQNVVRATKAVKSEPIVRHFG